MAYRTLEKRGHVAAVLALFDECEHRVERLEIARDDLGRVREAGERRGAREVALREHLLRDESLVGQRIRAVERIAGERRQAVGADREPVARRELAPAGGE